MFNRLIIVGAGGHGKVVADVALKIGYTSVCFLDDDKKEEFVGFSIIGTVDILNSLNDGKTDFVIAIGNNTIRERIAKQYNVNWVTLIHPSVQIGFNVKIDKGTVVMPGSIINSFAEIGKHCIINSGAIVEHDDRIESFVHLSPRVALGGSVSIGERTHVGIGATIINNVTVCRDCMIGAGAVVVKNASESGTYLGVPARKR